MDKYEVLGLLGEGSFGRVYKAKLICDSTTVALKVISKRGRSIKEIKGLRRECEIQRHLHHPNIIQMIDSFETDNEIVVITEFAHKELTLILSKEGYLPEERVRTIVWDLVSALYYLHSHRVLHRDLKPQNILLDSKNRAKLCDFGFARNMSTGTHVLTSIKGTPLYMAPELIEEHPYDHSADLWSLGCIIYELLVGAPPFCTTSILHLIRMIRHEQIQFPTFISSNCISFLKGLLQKDPVKRLTWPEILKHPFMKGHILILDDVASKPLTRPLSIDTLEAKEQQRKNCLTQKTQTKLPTASTDFATNEAGGAKCSEAAANEACAAAVNSCEQAANLETKFDSLSIDCKATRELPCNALLSNESKEKQPVNSKVSALKTSGSSDDIQIEEDCTLIENEEWVVFLLRTIEEVMAGEMTSLCQPGLASVALSPLRNSNASARVLVYAAGLFSLPFVVSGVKSDTLQQIKKVYLEIKLIPNLVYASKLMLKLNKGSGLQEGIELFEEDLLALERIYLIICHLVHLDEKFLRQCCNAIVALDACPVIRELLLMSKQKMRISTNLLAILTQILRESPQNSELIHRVIAGASNEENKSINFVQLLRHSSALIRERSCYFLQFLGRSSDKTLQIIWSEALKDTLEALVYDSIEKVRNAAEMAVEELKQLPIYERKNGSGSELSSRNV